MIYERTKTCTKCDEEKVVTEFYKAKTTKDGRMPHCKDCHIKITRASREVWYEARSVAEKKYMVLANNKIDMSFTRDEFFEWYENTPNLCCVTGMTDEESLQLRKDIMQYQGDDVGIDAVKRALGGRRLNTGALSVARNDTLGDYTLDNLRKVDIIISAYKPKPLTLEEFSDCGKLIIEKIRGELYGQK